MNIMLIHVQVVALGIVVITALVSVLASQYGSALVSLPKFMEEMKYSLKTLDSRVDIVNERLDALNERFGAFKDTMDSLKETVNLHLDTIVRLLDVYVFFTP